MGTAATGAAHGWEGLARSSREGSSTFVAAYLATLGAGSRTSMRSALEKIARVASDGREDATTFEWAAVRPAEVAMLRAALAETLAPVTVNRHLSALRGVLREAWRAGAIDTDAYHRAAAVRGVAGTRIPAGRDVSNDERGRLFDVCVRDQVPARGARDAALLAILVGAGLRRAELVGLDLAHLRLEPGELRVLGKGGKERIAFLVEGARAAVEGWLHHRGDAAGPLLCRLRRGGRVQLERLSPQAVRLVLVRRLEEAGLAHATPHDLRRTLCGDLLDAGADLASVQSLLGHASPAQTARYDRRGERARRKAAELASVPFAGPLDSRTPEPR